MLQNLSSVAVVIDALRVKKFGGHFVRLIQICIGSVKKHVNVKLPLFTYPPI